MFSESSIITLFEIEEASLLTVLPSFPPIIGLDATLIIVVTFLLSSYLVFTVFVSVNNHEDILEIFSKNWGALWTIHDSVKIIKLLLHLVSKLVR